METLWQDLRYGLRVLAKSPGFAAIAVLTLALGIGANSTIFSWINSTLLNPVPGLEHTSEFVSLSLGKTARNPFPLSYPDFVELRDKNRSCSGLTGFSPSPMSLTGTSKPERVWGVVASANYFDVLGVRPVLGRGFLPAEDREPGGAPVAVISYRLWQTRFAANPSIVGQTMEIDRHPYTIIGVTPAIFQGGQTGLRADLWIPVMMEQQVIPGADRLHDHHYFWLFVLGRLRPGVTLQQGQQEMTLLIQRIAEQYPEEHKGHESVTMYPLWRAPYGANAAFSSLLPMLMAISGVVLLLACANVANLLLVRSIGRRREIAVRLSIGASRWRLVRQLLIESLVLALAGGGLAMLLTAWTAGTMMKFVPPTNLPLYLSVRADRVVLLVTFVLSILTGVIFGILPALRSSSVVPVAVLKEDSGSASGGLHRARLASGLVVAQVALSLFLLICAGLFIRSFRQAQLADPGFNAEHVLLASYDLFPAGYSEAAGIEFHRQLLAKLEALPGVQSVTLSNSVPFTFAGGGSTSVKPEGYVWQAHESMEIPDAIVGPNYLRTMQIPVVAGREFTAQDAEKSQPGVIVNQAFADRYWPHQDALGKRLITDISDREFSVIGVARNSNYGELGETPRPFLFLPVYQLYRPGMIIHARVSGDPLTLASTVENAVHELNAELPVFDVTTLKSSEQLATVGRRIAGTFVGAFGLLALVLAAVGIYGVIAYTTRQRTHEIGIRMALGARRSDVFRLVLRQGLRLTLVGVVIGLVVSFGLTRFLGGLLFGVTTTDALTFASVAILLSVVALTACYVPARRATQVDPMVALRYE
ncbi:MAG: ABC transporter permease [Candidatus Acidiferrales bacterium]